MTMLLSYRNFLRVPGKTTSLKCFNFLIFGAPKNCLYHFGTQLVFRPTLLFF